MARDIIIHYDETEGKVVCSTVEHTLTAPLLRSALPLEVAIESLRNKTPDEAERSFGAGLFALLDLSAGIKIGVRDYANRASDWHSKHAKIHTHRIQAGDGEGQYERAMELITEGIREKSKKKMLEADSLLHLAADAGNAEAAEYLVDLWPSLLSRAESYR